MNKAILLCLATAMCSGTAVFAGCGSDGDDGDAATAGGCFDYTGFELDAPEVTLRADVLPILQNSCAVGGATCHGDAGNTKAGQHYLGESSGTTMTDEQIAEVLSANLNVASVKGGSMRVIVPGEPENSFLMAKMDGNCASNLSCTNGDCGAIMPQTNTEPLPEDVRNKVRRWIAQGAEDN